MDENYESDKTDITSSWHASRHQAELAGIDWSSIKYRGEEIKLEDRSGADTAKIIFHFASNGKEFKIRFKRLIYIDKRWYLISLIKFTLKES